MLKKIIPLALLPLSMQIFATENQDSSLGFSIGLGMVAQTAEYLGEGTDVMPFPTLGYEGERLFFRGAYGGVHLYKNSNFNISAIVRTNIQKMDVKDLSSSKLAEKNIRKDQLQDRDMSADAGLEAVWSGQYGSFSIQAFSDIGGVNKAAAAEANYLYFWNVNDKWTIIPNIGATWLSDDRANYYYGTLSSEEKKGVNRYRPDNLIIPHISLGASYKINPNWSATAVVTQKILPNKAANGPLIDNDSKTTFFIGASRKF